MNRENRRLQQKKRNAMARELMRAEKPPEYGLGFNDGGMAMCKACDASFAQAMQEAGFQASTIVKVLHKAHDKLSDFVLDDEKMQKAYNDIGILYDETTVFEDEKFTLK